MGIPSPCPCKGFHPLTLLRCAYTRSGGNKINWLKAAAKRAWGLGDHSLPRPVGETGRRSVGNRKERLRDYASSPD